MIAPIREIFNNIFFSLFWLFLLEFYAYAKIPGFQYIHYVLSFFKFETEPCIGLRFNSQDYIILYGHVGKILSELTLK